MIQLKCQECTSTISLNNAEKYLNKKVTFQCKSCGASNVCTINESYLSYTSIEETSDLGTEIVESGHQCQIAKIIFLDTEIQHYLTEGEYTFGRESNLKSSMYKVLNDSFISRQHFVITGIAVTKTEFEYLIRDNESKNGTFLNDVKLSPNEEVYLNNDDTIRAGETQFKLVFENLNLAI